MSQPTPNPRIDYPTAIVAVAFIAGVVVLNLTGRDTSVLVTVGLAILGLAGYGVLRTTQAQHEATAAKEQSNGNTARLLSMVERQGQMLAQMMPTALPLISATDDSTPDPASPPASSSQGE